MKDTLELKSKEPEKGHAIIFMLIGLYGDRTDRY